MSQNERAILALENSKSGLEVPLLQERQVFHTLAIIEGFIRGRESGQRALHAVIIENYQR